MKENQQMQRTLKYMCDKLRNCRYLIVQKISSTFQTINTAETWLTLCPPFRSSRNTNLPWSVAPASLKPNSRALKRRVKPIHVMDSLSMQQLKKIYFCSCSRTVWDISPIVMRQLTIIRTKNERGDTAPTNANIDSTRRPNLLFVLLGSSATIMTSLRVVRLGFGSRQSHRFRSFQPPPNRLKVPTTLVSSRYQRLFPQV
jgi:hypothetical protein